MRKATALIAPFVDDETNHDGIGWEAANRAGVTWSTLSDCYNQLAKISMGKNDIAQTKADLKAALLIKCWVERIEREGFEQTLENVKTLFAKADDLVGEERFLRECMLTLARRNAQAGNGLHFRDGCGWRSAYWRNGLAWDVFALQDALAGNLLRQREFAAAERLLKSTNQAITEAQASGEFLEEMEFDTIVERGTKKLLHIYEETRQVEEYSKLKDWLDESKIRSKVVKNAKPIVDPAAQNVNKTRIKAPWEE